MCGFLVSYNLETNFNNFNSALKKINYRGPDFSDIYYDHNHNTYIGHNRLSIIDIKQGNQPFWSNKKKIAIVYNGEIYNYKILKKELHNQGASFQSNSDTEVILKMYEILGINSFNKLDGMFAFVIIDFEKNIIISSKDFYGKKPIYYYYKNDFLVISSELSPIIHLIKNRIEISNKNFEFFIINGYYPQDKTIYNDINKQIKNSTNIYELTKNNISSSLIYDDQIKSYYHTGDFKQTIHQAVKKRLIADKEIGTFLSGGIDSTIISSVAKSINPDIKTFSIFFDKKEYDESDYIKQICKEHEFKNYSLLIDKKILHDSFDDIFEIDEPICDSSIIPTYLLSKFTKTYVDVALTGDGADEIFYGYNVFNALYLSYFLEKLKLNKIFNVFINEKKIYEGNDYFNKGFILKKFLSGLKVQNSERLREFLKPIYTNQIEELLKYKLTKQNKSQDNFQDVNSFMSFNRKIMINGYLSSNILVKCDLASMKASLELRSPFLDLAFNNNEFLFSSYKLDYKKKLFAKHMSGAISNKFINQKKHGFAISNDLIFNKKNTDYFYSLGNRFNLDMNYLRKLFDLNMNNKINLKNFFWGYLHLNKIIDKNFVK